MSKLDAFMMACIAVVTLTLWIGIYQYDKHF